MYIYRYMYVCIYICVCVCVCVYIYIYIHTGCFELKGQTLGWGFPGGSVVKNLPAMQEMQV